MRAILLLSLFLISVATCAHGSSVVENPAQPPEATLVLEANVEWSRGGFDDEEVLFGVIASLATDADGNAYVSDRQLTEVSKFSPEGEFLGFIGREGEGPGEYRRIGHVFMTPNGEIAVMQRMPGKIIPVRQDGTPGTTVELPDFLEGAPAYFIYGDMVGTDLVLSVRQFQRTDTGGSMTTSLLRIDASGELVARLSEAQFTRDPSMMTVDEKENAAVLWTHDKAGNLYVYDQFDGYSIDVYARDGTLIREIRREYDSRRRTEKEKQLNKPRISIRQRGGQRRELEGIPSETDRDIQALYSRPNGALWILSSRGALDTPDGVLVSMDEFDNEGNFLRQVDILGEGSFQDDGIRIDGDQLFILRGLRDARDAERGNGDGEDQDAEPMSVVSCRLTTAVR